MTLEWISALASIGTFVVIAATAAAAIVQLRHLRVSNQFGSMLAVFERYEDTGFNRDSDYVSTELLRKMEDPSYRDALESQPIVREDHPEIRICMWYEWVGTMIKRGLLPEDAFFDLAAPNVLRAWRELEPVIAVMRRKRGRETWENFEYLAARAMKWHERHPSTYPQGTARIEAADAYAGADAARHVVKPAPPV